MTDKVKHLELIQSVVNRLGNSFLIKGWSVTLTSALFALAAARSDRRFVLLSYFPVIMFWVLDSYFLYQERLFRKLYDEIRVATTSDFSNGDNESERKSKNVAANRLFHNVADFPRHHGVRHSHHHVCRSLMTMRVIPPIERSYRAWHLTNLRT
jgi:hypothetical protein